MTIDEKKKIILAHCKNCDTCPLNVGGWKKTLDTTFRCLDIGASDEDDLNRALKILGIYEVEQDIDITEAIAYIEKVLTWKRWRKHHTRLVKALEIILSKLSR